MKREKLDVTGVGNAVWDALDILPARFEKLNHRVARLATEPGSYVSDKFMEIWNDESLENNEVAMMLAMFGAVALAMKSLELEKVRIENP